MEIREVKTLGGERTNMVFYDDVLVDDDHRMGPEGQGWMVLHGPLNAEHRISEHGPQPVEEEGEAGMGGAVDLSGHILRVYEPALRAAVEWARMRGLDGRRPLDDPLVRVRLAEVELGVVVSKVTPGPPRAGGGRRLVRRADERSARPSWARGTGATRRTLVHHRRLGGVRPTVRTGLRHLWRHHRGDAQPYRRAILGLGRVRPAAARRGQPTTTT